MHSKKFMKCIKSKLKEEKLYFEKNGKFLSNEFKPYKLGRISILEELIDIFETNS